MSATTGSSKTTRFGINVVLNSSNDTLGRFRGFLADPAAARSSPRPRRNDVLERRFEAGRRMCPLWLARSPPRWRRAPGVFCTPAAFSYTIRVSRQRAANHVVNGGGRRAAGGADLPSATATIPLAAEAGDATTAMTGHSLTRRSSLSSAEIRAVYVTNANRRDGNLLLSQ